jgi:hypothetical protein
MSSRKQRNAQNSTGPSIPEDQAASRFNPLKHGIYAEHQIMFDETAGDLAELDAELRQQFSPANANARFLVDTLVNNEWRLRRMRRVEAVLWEHAADAFLGQHPESEACNSADAFVTNSGAFERLQRLVNSCERNYHRALKELQAKVGRALSPANVPANVPANPGPPPQKAEPEAAAQPAPAPHPQQSTPSSANLGSVRQNPKTPPPAPLATNPAAPAGPAETQPSPSDRFPTPTEAMDAASQAIFKQ